MGLVTYTPFAAHTSPLGPDVYGYFYTPQGDSLEVVNGSLEAINLSPDFEANYTLLQRNATSGGGMVAGTANLDFFHGTAQTDGWFRGIEQSGLEGSAADQQVVIPGGAIQFYLPYPAFVLLNWQITSTNDSAQLHDKDLIRLFVDGMRPGKRKVLATTDDANKTISSNVRSVGQTVFEAQITNGIAYMRDRYKCRYWSGHQWLDNLDQGWHSASLRLVSDSKQTRVRARTMNYIYFKRQT